MSEGHSEAQMGLPAVFTAPLQTQADRLGAILRPENAPTQGTLAGYLVASILGTATARESGCLGVGVTPSGRHPSKTIF